MNGSQQTKRTTSSVKKTKEEDGSSTISVTEDATTGATTTSVIASLDGDHKWTYYIHYTDFDRRYLPHVQTPFSENYPTTHLIIVTINY
jgi:hypothetical protein